MVPLTIYSVYTHSELDTRGCFYSLDEELVVALPVFLCKAWCFWDLPPLTMYQCKQLIVSYIVGLTAEIFENLPRLL